MPIPGARYRVVTTKKGKKVRLAFKGKGKGRVVEAKNLGTGAVHAPADLRDRKNRRFGGRPLE